MTAEPSGVDRLLVGERELATILACLRFHQSENLQSDTGIPDKAIKDVATDGAKLTPLDSKQVGELCERINLGPGTVRVGGSRRGPQAPEAASHVPHHMAVLFDLLEVRDLVVCAPRLSREDPA